MKNTNITKRPTAEAKTLISKAVAKARRQNRLPAVLFVCLGNICRSPAAQGITEKIAAEQGVAIRCDSAGFYGGHAGDLPDRRMREAAFARGYRLDHRSRRIRLSDLDDFDIVIGMDDSNLSDLHRLADTFDRDRKIIRMTDFASAHPAADCVPDPYYEGAAGFQLVLNLLEDACGQLVSLVKNEETHNENKL